MERQKKWKTQRKVEEKHREVLKSSNIKVSAVPEVGQGNEKEMG